jgi:tetratricopeptide (TPR) repeat protein
VDLARLYKIAGEHEKSMHCMVVATRLGPDNRFVIRAAARLFLHEREGLRALRLIRRAAGANSDPWLLAAEIATASAAGYPSLFAKVARSHSEDTSVSLFHRTELTSALATLDLENGKDRLARKLFRTSLKQPNENSLAQAEWANRQLGGLKVEEASLSTQRSFEARANLCAAQGSWIAAAEQGLKWFRDQPFAKRPAMFTSYVSSLIGEYSVSEQLLRRSLQINPNDPDLINNLAFAIASDDRPEEAAPYLKKINLATMSGTSLVTLLATHGLVLFRQHEDVEGRNLYRKAIDAAGNIGALKYKILATLYLAREEILCRSESWHDTFNEALRVSAKSEESDIKTVREQVISLGAGLQQRTSGGKSAAQ